MEEHLVKDDWSEEVEVVAFHVLGVASLTTTQECVRALVDSLVHLRLSDMSQQFNDETQRCETRLSKLEDDICELLSMQELFNKSIKGLVVSTFSRNHLSRI